MKGEAQAGLQEHFEQGYAEGRRRTLISLLGHVLKAADVLVVDVGTQAWWWKMVTLACWAMRIDSERATVASGEEAHRRHGPAVVLILLQGGRAAELGELRRKLVADVPAYFEVVVEAHPL